MTLITKAPDTKKLSSRNYHQPGQLIGIFEELESDVEFPVYLSKFPHFLDFLENGNTKFFETENEYTVLFYYKPIGGFYDRVIGVGTGFFNQNR